MFKVTVNTDQEREIELSGNDFTINGRQGTWDKISIGNHRFHIVKDNRSYTCEVLQFVKEKKTFSIRVNGTVYQVQVKDRFDALLKQLGMEEAAVMMVGLELGRVLQGLAILQDQARGDKRSLRQVADYAMPNVSDKVLRIIHSYTDYVNRVVWKKY